RRMLPVGFDRCANGSLAIFRPGTCRASRDFNTGGQPFKVPFPRSRERFVEIVDVENQVSLGRRESAEVHDVAITARLHAKLGRGGLRQSKAIIAAAPRRKVKGDLLIRAYRIGSSLAIRPLSESIRS